MIEPGEMPIFTAEGAWDGGHYDMSFVYAPRSDVDPALRAVWSFPGLEGPVASRLCEPWDQPAAAVGADRGELDGLVSLPGGQRSACATFVFRFDELDEVQFSIPVGSLAQAWPEVGAYPFGVTPAQVESWEQRLEELLVALARHVHARAPFLRAWTGFEGIGWPEDLWSTGSIPSVRAGGLLDVQGDQLVWHPPTVRGGFEFDDRGPLTL
jgi:hypothetical protein